MAEPSSLGASNDGAWQAVIGLCNYPRCSATLWLVAFLVACGSFALAACAPSRRTPSPPSPAPLETLGATTNPTLSPTPEPSLPTVRPLLIQSSLWRRIWRHDIDAHGGPLALSEGLAEDYWFLYDRALLHYLQEDDVREYRFDQASWCDDCTAEANGSIAVAPDGDVWLGLSNGLLQVSPTGDSSFIPSEEVFSSAPSPTEVFVLLSDPRGTIWVGGPREQLCSTDGTTWDCAHLGRAVASGSLENLEDVGHVLSAASGYAGEIWFGTTGRYDVIRAQGEVYTFINLREALDTDANLFPLTTLGFDEGTGALWGVAPAATCGEGRYAESIAVVSRGSDGDWEAYPRSLFFEGPSPVDLCYGNLTSLAIMPDGEVWVSMTVRRGLAHFRGGRWHAWDGHDLPDLREIVWSELYHVPDILGTQSGHLLVIAIDGIYDYLGAQQ